MKSLFPILAFVLLLTASAMSQTFTDEFHDFNDNLVPQGWTQETQLGGPGVSNGALRGNVTDGRVWLRRQGTMPSNSTGIKIEYDGNIAYSYWGLHHLVGVELATGDLYQAGNSTAQYNYGPHIKIRAHGGSEDLYWENYPLEYGNYHHEVTFYQGRITYKAVRISDGYVLCDLDLQAPGLDLQQITQIFIHTGTTEDNNAWSDNLRVTVLYEGDEQDGFCDEFNGSSINTNLWTVATGSWSQSNGQLVGYWPITNANQDCGNIQLTDAYQPEGDFVFNVETAVIASGENANKSNTIRMRQSYHNSFYLSLEVGNGIFTAAGIKNGNHFFITSGDITPYANAEVGDINIVRLERIANTYRFFLNGNHELCSFDDIWFNGDVKLGLGTYGVSTFERVCLEYGGGGTGAPPAPILVSPSDGSQDVSTNPTIFAYEEIAGYGDLDYQIMVSTDENFDNIVISNFATDGEYQTNQLQEGTEYFWKMRASNGQWGEWSQMWSFVTAESPNYSECYITGQVYDATQIDVQVIPDSIRIALLKDTLVVANYDIPVIIYGNHFYADLEPYIGENKVISLNDLYSTEIAIRIFVEVFGPDDYDPTKLVDGIIYDKVSEFDFGLVPNSSDITWLQPWNNYRSHFDIDYDVEGENAVPQTQFTVLAEGYNDKKVPVFINEIAQYLEFAWQSYVDLGFWDGLYMNEITVEFDKSMIHGEGLANRVPAIIRLFNKLKYTSLSHTFTEFESYATYKQTVAHEVCHHVLYRQGDFLLNNWIREGIPVVAANLIFHNSYIDLGYSSQTNRILRGPINAYNKRLVQDFQDVAAAYIMGGCFFKYFTERFGTTQTFIRYDGSSISIIGADALSAIIHEINLATIDGEETINDALDKLNKTDEFADVYYDWVITNSLLKYNLQSDCLEKYCYKEYNIDYPGEQQYFDPLFNKRIDFFPPTVEVDPSAVQNCQFPDKWTYRSLGVIFNSGTDPENDIIIFVESNDHNTIDPPATAIIVNNTVTGIERSGRIAADIDKDSLLIVPCNVGPFADDEVRVIVTEDYDLVVAHSPVDLRIIGPNGGIISKSERTLRGSLYEEVQLNGGAKEDHIFIPLPERGIYHIEVIPDSTATPDSIFSIEYRKGHEILWLAVDQQIADISDSGYLYSTLDTGSVAGIVAADGDPLQGVPVDLYDSSGAVCGSMATDEMGAYEFAGLNNGSYSVSISSPLGYQATEETSQVQVRGLPHEINFELTELEITPQVRSRGYWAHQMLKAVQNKPKDYTTDDFASFAGLINQHFNQNELNPVDFYSVPQPASQSDSLMVLKDLLHMCSPDDEWQPLLKRLARAQLMALMLNVVSGKVHQMHAITEDGRTVSQLITYCDMLVNDEIDPPDDNGCPGHGSAWFRYIYASYMLTRANLGLSVPAGMVPEDVINIAYKIQDQVPVPDGYELGQNYPNPFNPETEISYSIPEAGNVKLEIFNIMGQKVRTLADEYQDAGSYSVKWNGTDSNGSQVSSGIYLYRLTAGEYVETRKMSLMK